MLDCSCSPIFSCVAKRLARDAQGHQVSGAIADQLLSPNASQKVQHILEGMPLQVASTWADCVKDVVHRDGGFV
jgi:hypothetical protein